MQQHKVEKGSDQGGHFLKVSSAIGYLAILFAFSGCPAMTPQGSTLNGGGPRAADGDVDASSDDRIPSDLRSQDLLAKNDQPQAGGVAAMPAETEDEKVIAAEGAIEATCRDESETVFSLNGRVVRIHRRDGVEKTRTEVCYEGGMKMSFSDGFSCQIRDVPAKACAIQGVILARDLRDVRFFIPIEIMEKDSVGLLDPDKIKYLSPSPSDEANSGDLVDKSRVAEVSAGSFGVYARPSCFPEEGYKLPVENRMALTLSESLPECPSRRESVLKKMGLF